ncbi:MAG: hypothetical protein GQ534_10825 [Candidatus Delongbacteria bacterium]|nr:hypothetical protein [Candidatus Delongbacteria bacterium]
MKKLILGLLILATVFTAPLNASADPYPDWDWNGVEWVYSGDGNQPMPPPPPLRD